MSKSLATKALDHIYTDLLMLEEGTWVPDRHSINSSIDELTVIAEHLGTELRDTREVSDV
jgi:hypothetical protein